MSSVDSLLWIAFEMVTGLMALWLLRTMPPLAYTTRYLWTPPLASIAAYIVLHPPFVWRLFAGACMIAGGAVFLMREQSDVSGEILGLR